MCFLVRSMRQIVGSLFVFACLDSMRERELVKDHVFYSLVAKFTEKYSVCMCHVKNKFKHYERDSIF